MQITDSPRRPGLRLLTMSFTALFVVAACASSGSAGWTYAPLGPTPDPSGSAAPSPTPGASPDVSLTTETPESDPLAFVPSTLEMPAGALVQVTYNNNSSIEHNINFFDGPDQNSPSLGATARVTGPNAPESVTFTAPSEAGTYYFWCDVHLTAMQGNYTVTP